MTLPNNRNWDWLSSSLLFVLIQVVAARLVITNWAPFLYFCETLSALGTILGFALGTSRLSRRAVTGLAVGYTLVLLPWQAASTVSDKLYLDRLTHIGAILLTSLNQFLQRQPVKNPLFFVGFICIVFWVLSLIAGYWLVRHSKVLTTAIIPFGVTFLLIQYYSDYQQFSSWWLAMYMLVALLLIGREYYRQNLKVWAQHRVFIGEGSWSNILGGLFTSVATAILIAWLIPTSISSLKSAADSWSNFTRPLRERLSNAVTSLNGTYGTSTGNFFGTTLPLGQDAASGNTTVFTVDVINPPDFNIRYYWRGRVYDNYANGQWTNSTASNVNFIPNNGNLYISNENNQNEALFQIRMGLSTQSLLYAPSQLVWVNRPSSLQVISASNQLEDVLYWVTKLPIRAGEQYEARSEFGNPNIQQLQAADTIYPQWITDRYLEIPEQLRPDFQSLAENVTSGLDNPFDKTAAITNYLRASLKYSTSVPAAPNGQDPIAWVVFDYKKGFCNYYASAEVLMLRSIGIPARLAVGFAQGQHQNNIYTVQVRDAHAWPEVYFPSVGWVEFEPTANQEPLVRPTAASSTNGTGGSAIFPRKPSSEGQDLTPPNTESKVKTKRPVFSDTILGRALFISLLLASAAVLVLLFRRYKFLSNIPVYLSKTFERSGMTPPTWMDNWSRWNQLSAVERSFASINWSLRLVGKPQALDATPAERATLLKKLLPAAAIHIEALKLELEAQLFSPQPGDPHRARRASYFILFYVIRDRLMRFLGTADNLDVYSK